VSPVRRSQAPTDASEEPHKGLLTPHGVGFLHTRHDPSRFRPTYVATAGIADARPDLLAGRGPVHLRADAQRFEIGNLNIAGIHALGGALALLEEVGVDRVARHLFGLGDQLIEGLDRLGIELVGPREAEHRAPHIYVLRLASAEWASYLQRHDVRVSAVRDGIRVSFGMYNTPEDVERLLSLVVAGQRELGTPQR
jgi:cysteine desulfurase/selenocysteine lyase